ncbi:Cell division protein FtsB [Arsenophonus endosymbiont of Aleurodicus floccissimus]|uniref:cell division protein FtsB n=1 Tax=Arsenophonus endosymbiont of Aleurodicus floccissimus TaxID=2152761 RepID=UPI000E6B4675|nr:cell division protein FtsB [Arsenophonus endosymbiont of Aleurodicus floccissimus]SPP32395.1 Cell division protein FtsB [Arsenophonus endosymbiont of Aleurodicus floccissimus]
MRKLALILLAVFCWLQYSLWFGKNGVHDYLRIKSEVVALETLNTTFKVRNERLFAEIDDLNEGREAIEERARSELGLIRPEESFYRIVNENAFPNHK